MNEHDRQRRSEDRYMLVSVVCHFRRKGLHGGGGGGRWGFGSAGRWPWMDGTESSALGILKLKWKPQGKERVKVRVSSR